MRFAFVLFDEMTALDFVGVFDPISRVRTMGIYEAMEWELVARSAPVTATAGLTFQPTVVARPLDRYDAVIVPGGAGTRILMRDEGFLEWLRSARDVPLVASVCSGALLLGAAGFLRGKKATTHHAARKELEPYCQAVVEERIVDEGSVVTAGGVTAGIDLGLHLVQRLFGPEVREAIAARMEYERG